MGGSPIGVVEARSTRPSACCGPLLDPTRELYVIEIGAAAGLPGGTIQPILARAGGAPMGGLLLAGQRHPGVEGQARVFGHLVA
jgi:hypothetical protein